MKVTQVVVEAHEKRSHPSEHGHRDASITYTAEIHGNEDFNEAVSNLRLAARWHVADELDKWIAEIKTREAQDKARNDLQWIVDRLENRLPTDKDTEQFEDKLALLPDNEHADWRIKLKAAQDEFLTRIKGDLDKIVERAGRKQLSPRDNENFGELMERLSDDEYQVYHVKMVEAKAAFELGIAPQPEETAAQARPGRVESKSSGDKEEIPF